MGFYRWKCCGFGIILGLVLGFCVGLDVFFGFLDWACKINAY